MDDKIVLTGLIGLVAAVLVGTGEFLLHFTNQGYDSKIPYHFMLDISRNRLTVGHFIAVLAAPLYLVGFWHLYKMLEPAGGNLPLITTMVIGYGFIMGIIWIGSRAMIGSIIQSKIGPSDLAALIQSYQLYDESLLQIIRFTTLLGSAGFIYLVLNGNTAYPNWMWVFNPIFLLVSVFLIYLIIPAVGKYIMPIAMNVTYTIFFALSTYIAFRLR
ncbi:MULTISPECIES: DUF6796 family protein [Legionella]|uniref:Uncharacterized protein n=1 Tax=Legionella donaldsonii TaxID=45060 RepID=A0A378IZD3_9GAMM|nr:MULTISPECIES: DUF6796 family protein [Legionella]MCC5015060.1 hypothetical protein [Legionella sp. 31fI33]STX40823.1 Uncharacterised protein [Legionella donaldsonii]